MPVLNGIEATRPGRWASEREENKTMTTAMTANQSRDCEGGVSVDVAAIPSNPAPPSRLGWHLTLFSAGLLYTFADLVFNLEIPLLGVAIVVLLGRELMHRDVGRVS